MVLNTHNSKIQKHYLSRWYFASDRLRDQEREDFKASENRMIQSCIEMANNFEDVQFHKDQELKTQQETQHRLARLTLGKVVSRFKNHAYYTFLMRWKEAVHRHHEAQRAIKTTFYIRFLHKSQRRAFTIWRSNLLVKFQTEKKFSHGIEVENEQIQLQKLSQTRTKISQIREKTAYELDALQDQKSYQKSLYLNTLDKLVRDRQENFVVKKKAHFFDTWRQIGSRHARFLRLLESHMTKNLLQTGFDGICVALYRTNRFDLKTKILSKLCSNHRKVKLRMAVCCWQQKNFENSVVTFERFRDLNNHAQANSDITRQQLTQRKATA